MRRSICNEATYLKSLLAPWCAAQAVERGRLQQCRLPQPAAPPSCGIDLCAPRCSLRASRDEQATPTASQIIPFVLQALLPLQRGPGDSQIGSGIWSSNRSVWGRPACCRCARRLVLPYPAVPRMVAHFTHCAKSRQAVVQEQCCCCCAGTLKASPASAAAGRR